MGSGIQRKIRETNDAASAVTNQLNEIKTQLSGLANETNAKFQKLAGWIDNTFQKKDEILDALITILGTEAVFNQIKKAKIEKAEANSAAMKDALEKQLAEGGVKVSEVVGELSIIVGSEVDKDGNQIPPARAQVLFAQLTPELAALMLGKKVGDVVETPVGSKFTISELYDMVLPDPANADVKANEVVSTSDGSVN